MKLDGIYDMVSFSPSYSAFVRSFYEKACAGSDSSVKSLGSIRSDVFYSGEEQSDFMLTLTDEQLETFASASYVILKRDPWKENAKDVYIRVFYSVDTVLDGNRLFATYNDRATFLFDGESYSELPLMMMERNAPVNGVHRYEYAGVLFFKKDSESDPLESIVANVQFCVNEQTHEVTILNAVPVNNDGTEKPDVQHSRTQIDLSQIDTYEFVSNTYRLTRDKKGNVLPSNRWETAEDEVKVLGVGFNPAEGHRFIQRPLEKEERGNYYCQFLITDVYGNQYGTELIPFEN